MDKEEIKYLLIRKGLKLADVDRRNNLRYGVSKYALKVAHPRGELAISKELGVPLQVLFPERYDKTGKRHKNGKEIRRDRLWFCQQLW